MKISYSYQKLFTLFLLSICIVSCTKKIDTPIIKIGIIGDSISGVGTHETFGMWARMMQMVFFPEYLQEKFEDDPRFELVVVDPQAGSQATSGPKRVRKMLQNHSIDLLIFELGANDLLKGGKAEMAAKAIDESITIALSKNIHVLLVGMQSSDYRQG
ncbi:MAG: hypothetical protein R3A11_03895 [Bdellovibrionota bacterium]